MSYYIGKKGAFPEATVEWVSATAFRNKDQWEGHMTIAYQRDGDEEGFGDPQEVVWKERGRSAWEALTNAITRLEREGRESKELEFWGDDPPVKLLWPRFKTLPEEPQG